MDREKICSVLEKYKGSLTIGTLAQVVEGGEKRFCTTGACLREAGVPDNFLLDADKSTYTDIPLDRLPEDTVEILEDFYGADQLRAGWGPPTIKLFGILRAVYGMDANRRQQIMEVNDYGGFGGDESTARDIYSEVYSFLGCDDCDV